MSFFINEEEWDENFNGWLINGCAIVGKNAIFFCSREDLPFEESSSLFDHDIATRLTCIMLGKEEGKRSFSLKFTNLNRPMVGVARGLNQGLLAANNKNGQVWPFGVGKNGPYEHILPGGWPAPNRIVCLNGNAWSVGGFRQIFKRVDNNEWIPVNKGFPKTEPETEHGFNDMDAFSDSDMYAVGGQGDVWHYDGDSWSPCGFPTNMQLSTVTCGGDGNVYIGGQKGTLWVGREHTWECAHRGEFSSLWNDSVWFQNKLWLVSDYGSQIWDGKKMNPIEYQGEVMQFTGHMDAYDDMLVIADSSYVWQFNGEHWRCLVAPYDE